MHVPGWHAATREAQEAGRLSLLGIVLEQHPERARLFMQWQEMPWRLLHDPFNLLALPYVPLTLAIDEWGMIRAAQPQLARAAEFIERFVAADLAPPAAPPTFQTRAPDIATLQEVASADGNAAAWAELGVQLTLWRGEAALSEALAAGERALSLPAGERAQTHFQQGVVYRMRHDSAAAAPDDFQSAVRHWSAALQQEPNNYIWRRRIQQYGPRLAKPYSFYDWVPQARREIRERREEPRVLSVEPGGAEFAYPADEFASQGLAASQGVTARNGQMAAPDAEARILRDEELIQLQWVAVPPSVIPGEALRVHFLLQPQDEAHWNNESEPLALVLEEAPSGWQWETRRLWGDLPAEPTSSEARHLEVEIRAPEEAAPGPVALRGYALYYVCADASGVCLYLRQDFAVDVEVLPEAGERLKDPGPPRPGTQSANPRRSPG